MNSLKLPLLQHREAALETCAYCPKLCRAACPVSDAESSETLTPWGKMGLAWYQARGSLELHSSYAASAWACTGCFACRERCDHRNPVADTLLDARAEFFVRGLAPERARAVAEAEPARSKRRLAGVERLYAHAAVDAGSPRALLLGCAYASREPAIARQALDVVGRLLGPVRLLTACCGAVSRAAGDRERQLIEEAELAQDVGAATELVVLDPGCMGNLRERGALTLVEVVARRLHELSPLPGLSNQAFRWHDPCQLGRGLGVYEEPRAILSRILARPAAEFARSREEAVCSGAGGLLPVTMPATSRSIAAERLRDHDAQGGGTVVTACASSLRRFRASGADAVDLMSLVAQSLSLV